MATATFNFYGELAGFLAPAQRGHEFVAACARAATLKNASEALGVPHTEVGRLLCAGMPVTLSRTVRDGDAIEVFPFEPGAASSGGMLLFFADAHLGGLARFLRMLGFDTLYDNSIDDAALIAVAHREQRIILTRDRELLKCRDVPHGCFVHTIKVEAQLIEVATRYGLAKEMRPFTLCLHCNLALVPATPAEVRDKVPEPILGRYAQFVRCPGCECIYWPGSHWERMRGVLASVLGVQLPSSATAANQV